MSSFRLFITKLATAVITGVNWVTQISTTKALLISTGFLLIIAGYSLSALSHYWEYQAMMTNTQSGEFPLTLGRFQYFVWNQLQHDLIRWTAPKPDLKAHAIESFYLTLDKKDLKKLSEGLPQSMETTLVPGFLRTDEGVIYNVKIRYRGDGAYHWYAPQKSMRIKLSKNDVYQMNKKFNLVNPPQAYSTLADPVLYETARKIGLLTPDCFNARVFINNHYMGVYNYLSQTDESLLRKSKRMPGSIYSGDSGEVDEEGVSRLWKTAQYWTKQSARNAENTAFSGDIVTLIEGVNTPNDQDFYDFFRTYLDADKFYAYFALDVITGSAHHDFFHNHKLYFDPYKGRFEPIVWDIRQISAFPEGKDLSYYPLLRRVKLNPILESERDKVAYQILKQYSPQYFKQALQKQFDTILPDLKADIYKDAVSSHHLTSAFFNIPYSVESLQQTIGQLEETFQARARFLTKTYQDSQGRYLLTRKNGTVELVFEVNGNSGFSINLHETLHLPENTPIYKDVNSNKRLDSSEQTPIQPGQDEILYPGRREVPGNIFARPEMTTFYGNRHLVNAPLHYRYWVKQSALKTSPVFQGRNVVTNTPVQITPIHTLGTTRETRSVHPWSLHTSTLKDVTLQGVQTITRDRIYEANTRVTIQPGTTFKMSPGTSLIFYGPVNAVGKTSQPIRVTRAIPSKVWGAVVVQGQAASGSRLEHWHVSGGSKTTQRLISYTGQFNIHDVSRFEFAHNTLESNQLGDDNLHIAYSNGDIRNNVFKNSFMDAVDIDISKITLQDNLFLDSGNDLLDLMTSEVKVTHNVFHNSGDKCISTGEWSQGDYRNNLFSNCRIALEVKDKSHVSVLNSLIMNSSQHAINLYRKNPYYDTGGTIEGHGVYALGKNHTIKQDKRSNKQLSLIMPDSPSSKKGLQAFLIHWGLPSNLRAVPQKLTQKLAEWETMGGVSNAP
jgi:CotH kinase protein/Right handed beta helix region